MAVPSKPKPTIGPGLSQGGIRVRNLPLDWPTAIGLGQCYLFLPFDAMRFHYANAVLAGLAQRSIRASARLEMALDAMEKLMLGPLARRR